MYEPHIISGASTEDEIFALNNRCIREAYVKAKLERK